MHYDHLKHKKGLFYWKETTGSVKGWHHLAGILRAAHSVPVALVVPVILLPRSPSAVTIPVSIRLSVTIPMPAGRASMSAKHCHTCVTPD